MHRLLKGGQVSDAGGGPLPNVGVEDPTKPTEALKEGVDADVKELSERVMRVEKEVETLQPTEKPDDGKE